MKYIIVIALLNVVTFVVYGLDKYRAKHNQWRIPESTLLTMAAAGGSLGAWIGMKVWHHKTLHYKFKWGIPLIIALQFIFLMALYT